MTESVQQVWDRFERWVARYNRTMSREIDKIVDAEGCESIMLPLARHWQIGGDLIVGFHEGEDFRKVVRERISFFRAYLCDISFDGGEFMSRFSQFLPLQYPSRCERTLGVWLEQELEGEPEAGSDFGFQGFDASFFVKSLKDVDMASMRSVLPFDQMYLRKADGDEWSKREVKDLKEHLQRDLEHDAFYSKIRASHESEFLVLKFSWQ